MRSRPHIDRRWWRRALITAGTATLLTAGLNTPAQAATRSFAGFGLTANGHGYLMVSTRGEFYAFGDAAPEPNPNGFSGDIADVAVTADGRGAMAVSTRGQFYAYGTVRSQPNPSGFTGNIVAVAVTADGQGTVAVSDHGQFYAYGTAKPQPNPSGFTGNIVDVALTADGQGTMAVSDHGQFYAYGTAKPQPNPNGYSNGIVGLDVTADGQGAVAVSGAGQLYAYGTAHPQNNPTNFTGGIAGVDLTADGQGLVVVSGSGQVYAYGTAQSYGNGDPGSAGTTSTQATAQAILANRNIDPIDYHVGGTGDDGATARDNLEQIANGGSVIQRSSYSSGGRKAPGGTTGFSVGMVNGIASIGSGHRIQIVEIAGGVHAAGSAHYRGVAVDIDNFDGQAVSATSNYPTLVSLCRNAGAATVYDPAHDPDGSHKNHVHCEWSS